MIKLFAPRMRAFVDPKQFKVDVDLQAGPNFTITPGFSYETINLDLAQNCGSTSHPHGPERHSLHVVPCSGWRDAPGNPIFHGDILSPPHTNHKRNDSSNARALPTIVCIISDRGYQSLENAVYPGQNFITSIISHGYQVTGNAFLDPSLVHPDHRHHFTHPFTKPEEA